MSDGPDDVVMHSKRSGYIQRKRAEQFDAPAIDSSLRTGDASIIAPFRSRDGVLFHPLGIGHE